MDCRYSVTVHDICHVSAGLDIAWPLVAFAGALAVAALLIIREGKS